MELNKDNYFSLDADKFYYSASQIKAFLNCENSAKAMIDGLYKPVATDALLIGSYVDAYFEGSLGEFKDAHPEIFNSRTGELKAGFKNAENMIARATSDKVFMEYMDGDKQKILTGELFGLPFKAKLDVYMPGKRIVDLKTAADLKDKYKNGEGYMTFAEYFRYPLQLAIYQALEGNKLPCYLAVVTKEDPADLALIEVPQSMLDAEMEYLKEVLPRIDAVKKGIIEPRRCNDCAWCRESRVLTEPISLADLKEWA